MIDDLPETIGWVKEEKEVVVSTYLRCECNKNDSIYDVVSRSGESSQNHY